ncbi:MAG: FkbM family methyltransferase [Cyanobacteriota bacterium]|nr:FkbM family methyltransferase [Cyanobacteriota bacterium]
MAFAGIQPDLVFDLGFHRGEDTGYYLALGRRVVAVDANAELIMAGHQRFAAAIAAQRLILVNAALVGSRQRDAHQDIDFYPHPTHSEWGSVDQRWVRRNAEAHGLPHSDPVRVPTLSLMEMVLCYGCPGFLKIDIEGSDEAVLADLEQLEVRPTTVSWETGKESLRHVLRQHRRMEDLGYGRFRVVQQAFLSHTPPAPCPDGSQWLFEDGCSGPLPELSPQAWESRWLVAWRYRWLFLAYALVGPRSWFRALARQRSPWIAAGPRWVQGWAARHQFPLPGWVDSHALLTDPHRGSGAARGSGYEVVGQMARAWQ